ncbi:MAG: hypothetical protein ACKO9G_01820, partial [Dolichospermum sp.]
VLGSVMLTIAVQLLVIGITRNLTTTILVSVLFAVRDYTNSLSRSDRTYLLGSDRFLFSLV